MHVVTPSLKRRSVPPKRSFEAWWGPDGFAVTVRKLDLRPGGELVYAMTAVGSDQIEFMKKAGCRS